MNKANKNKMRECHPFDGIVYCIRNILQQMESRHEIIRRMMECSSIRVITNYAAHLLNTINVSVKTSGMKIWSADNNTFQVSDAAWTRIGGTPLVYEVDIKTKTCTCVTFLQTYTPCIHIVATERDKRSQLNTEAFLDYFHPAYHFVQYKSNFNKVRIRYPKRRGYDKYKAMQMCPRYNQCGRRPMRRFLSKGDDKDPKARRTNTSSKSKPYQIKNVW